ncbi:MAG: zinc-binding alcohol dehydrogenase family protein [Phycisphaerae bacterium]
MKAVGFTTDDPESLVDFEMAAPRPGPQDLLVKIKAVALNPLDVRLRATVKTPLTHPRILGWDAAGIVEDMGAEVEDFQLGDAVYYAGSTGRPGCNSELHVVDASLVARKPAALDWSGAAALPLTALTAWEAFFERLAISRSGRDVEKTILILGGSGGVGSIGIQLAKWAGLTVATTAGADALEWCRTLGADHAIDYSLPLLDSLHYLGIKQVDYAVNFIDTDKYWPLLCEITRPLGKMLTIVDGAAPLDMNLMKAKSLTFTWEFVFTKINYPDKNAVSHGNILAEIAQLVDHGKLRTTLTRRLGKINAANIRGGHELIASGHTIGKLALEGWN